MKSPFTGAAWLALACMTMGAPAFAQLQDNSEKQLNCANAGYESDRVRHCEMREQTAPSIGRLTVDAVQNGSATVKGWLRSEVLVRARVESASDTEAAAAGMARQVSIDTSGGQVRAMGPEAMNDSWWSVTYEIFVPQNTDLNLKAHNGGITISDVRGQIRFEGHNGSVRLRRVAGDVSGGTVNGSVQVDLTGGIWDGRQLEVSTHNGGVTINMPAYYSGHFQAETQQGRIQTDFPVTVAGNLQPHHLDFNSGAGGPLIHVTTVNGGVRLHRGDTQQ
ncbi:MAG TPA: hypothetical protein VGS58_05180 [Candidatus Sulfopaludibacter sp.]|nr:hypothetical protein [Candidatus Sulfopaludibacter sp.]